MKLTMLLLTLAGLQVTANTYSQEKITLKMQTADIRKVLFAIEKRSGYRFLFDEDIIKGKPKVNVEAEEAGINELLQVIFANTGITYTILHTNLIVLKQSDSPGNSIIQEIKVTGRVTSPSGEPLSGVSVTIKGSSMGTTTDQNGNYSLTVPDDAVLLFSYVGFMPTEETVGSRTAINVTLQPSTQTMDEAVVIGYGTQRRSQITGSVVKVSGKELAKQPLLTAAQALQGKAAGVQVIGSGAPGSQPQVRIRGTSTVSGNANPVYIVDGVITDDITNLNTADIESVEVLKDASSQAIYGSRGSNGVILVTTKTGKKGKVRISVDSYVGFRTPTSKIKMADAKTYAQYTNETRSYQGLAPAFNLDTLKYDTDWFDEITHNGLVQNHVLGLGGGTDNTSYYFSAGLFTDKGIQLGADFTRGTFRLNNEYRLAPFLKLGHNMTANIAKSNNKGNQFQNAYRNSPTVPVKFDNGAYGYTDLITVGNPVAALEYTNSNFSQVRFVGNAYAELSPVKGLTIRSSFNIDKYNNKGRSFTPKYFVWSAQQNSDTSLTISQGDGFGWIFDNYATYSRTIGREHEISLTAGYTSERRKYYSLSVTGKGVPYEDNLWYLSQARAGSITLTDAGGLTKRASYYGRLSYTLMDKYNINGVLRRDGSSNFPVNEKWGTFYSAGASWIVTREAFMDNQDIFNELKVRVGYGKIGNDRSVDGSALNPVTQNASAYSFDQGNNISSPGITFATLPNAKYSWETTSGIDAGVEFSVLNSRLTGDITYYNKLTNAYVPITIGQTFGTTGTVISQAADVRNKGVEITLRYSDKIGADFTYYIGGNITLNKNNVEKVNGVLKLTGGSLGNGQTVTYTVEGQPIGSFYAYNVLGIIKDAADAASYPVYSGYKPGDLKFEDRNKDGVIDDKDKMFVGAYQPKTYYGINGGFTWKSIDFSFDCYGNAGNKIYNGKKAVLVGYDNIEMSRTVDRWTTTNTDASNPRASSTGPLVSTYYIESGSFFRINNITAGYTFSSLSKKTGIARLRVYASAQNPVIFKQFSGYTPELPGGPLDSGIELNLYPVSSTYLLGVNISF
ncbi:TonB-dependent receptor [Pseudoflavitalea sp. X16]|uniref:TonB-dependent receptor n=1 Tax=Paraflavitalea devenefica TaxID=2716334 RepID=UPI00141F165F|nr:TonB-dependent receptor [Paraflavitalea devenefica]NII28025.1 TonB-dependent receptor [Paraflavitalea devenefica]